MDKTEQIRNAVIKNLKKDSDFCQMEAEEVNGSNFSAADITLRGCSGNKEVYRIVVIKHTDVAPCVSST